MSTTIFVVSGGVMDDIGFLSDEIRRAENPIIICADGAAQKLKVLDIVPDYIVGDMDSVEEETLRYFETRGSQISRYSKDKDETDTQLALEFAFGMNPDRIRIFGALGGRVDHTLANISLLVLCAKRKIDARIVDRWCELFVIDGSCVIEGRHGETVSLLPLSTNVSGIRLEGFRYPLTDAVMEIGVPYGISNRLMGTRGTISITSGYLLVIRQFGI